MTDILKQIMAEYDKAKDDAAFDEGHPIFMMAAHIDHLKSQLDKVMQVIHNKKWPSSMAKLKAQAIREMLEDMINEHGRMTAGNNSVFVTDEDCILRYATLTEAGLPYTKN